MVDPTVEISAFVCCPVAADFPNVRAGQVVASVKYVQKFVSGPKCGQSWKFSELWPAKNRNLKKGHTFFERTVVLVLEIGFVIGI